MITAFILACAFVATYGAGVLPGGVVQPCAIRQTAAGQIENYVVMTLTMNVGKWNDDHAPEEERGVEFGRVMSRSFRDLTCRPYFVAISIQEGKYDDLADEIMAQHGYAPALKGKHQQAADSRSLDQRCFAGGPAGVFVGRRVCVMAYILQEVAEIPYDWKVISHVHSNMKEGVAKGHLVGILKIGDPIVHIMQFIGAHFAAHVSQTDYDVRRVEFATMSEVASERSVHYAEKHGISPDKVVSFAFGDWNTRMHIWDGEVYGIAIPPQKEKKWEKPFETVSFKTEAKGGPWGVTFVQRSNTFYVTVVEPAGQAADNGVQVGWKIEEIDKFEINKYNFAQHQREKLDPKSSCKIKFNTDTEHATRETGLQMTEWPYDGLYRTMNDENLFDEGWREVGAVAFPPTYRFQTLMKTNPADEITYNLVQIPSWTDRILVQENTPGAMKALKYWSIRGESLTDHSPVVAAFSWSDNFVSPPGWQEAWVEPAPTEELFRQHMPRPQPRHEKASKWRSLFRGCAGGCASAAAEDPEFVEVATPSSASHFTRRREVVIYFPIALLVVWLMYYLFSHSGGDSLSVSLLHSQP